MTLHEAIKAVLMNYGKLDFVEIANAINKHAIYKRKDDEPVQPGQVKSRIGKYPEIFTVKDGIVYLKSLGLERLKEIIDILNRVLRERSAANNETRELLIPAF